MAPENGEKKTRDNVGIGCALIVLVVVALGYFGSGSGDKDGATRSPQVAPRWYEGGFLHRANVGEWRGATYSNKLATAADWAMTHRRVKARVMGSGSIANARPYAVDLVRCIDEAAGPSGYAHLRVTELATACMVSLRW